MRKIKDALRLKLDARMSHQQIASALAISKGVVTKYVGLADLAALDHDERTGNAVDIGAHYLPLIA